MRIALYVRVSTSEQSNELQKRELLQYCQARGWSDLRVFEDIGSGTNTNRPALKNLLTAVNSRSVDLVLIWKLDRLFRSLRDLVNTLQDFSDKGVAFLSLKDQIDLTTSSGKLLMHLLGAFAQFEADLIRSRVRAGLENAKANGRRLGRPIKRNDEDIIRLKQEGLSLRQISHKLSISVGAIQRSLRVFKTRQNSEGKTK